MLNTLSIFLAIFGYLLATVLIATALRPKSESTTVGLGRPFRLAFMAASLAAAAHILYVSDISQAGGVINFSLSSMTAVVSAMLVSIFLLACLAMPIGRLGIMVFPLAAASLVFSHFWASEADYLQQYSGAFSAHILIALLAYSLLAIATIQALLYVYQERQIKNRATPAMLMALPPLQTMEVLLFRLVGAGFILLTLTLLSGAVFSQQIFDRPFEFKHHTVLAIMGWLVFAVLLFRRMKYGLRGSRAVIWTVVGFVLIQLGYFGTKIVSESLHNL